MKLIGLSGYAQSGKDTFANILVEEYGFERRAFADKLREFLYLLNPVVLLDSRGALHPHGWRVRTMVDDLGWEGAKKAPEVRALLQRLGTDAGRKILGENVWVNALMADLDPEGKYVITDMRFPNEYDAVSSKGGHCVRIIRPGYRPVNGHISETALDKHGFDYVVNNNSWMGHLYIEAYAVMNRIWQ